MTEDTRIEVFRDLMNKYGSQKEPFLFIIDFEMKCPEIHKLSDIPEGIKFATPLLSVMPEQQIYSKPFSFKKFPVPFSKYCEAFSMVKENICHGNSYLVNLTFKTELETELTLKEIFSTSYAKYKLLYHHNFVVFSPEIFVRISNGKIKSYPMKGTIDAAEPNAEMVILSDLKEEAEHNTIVDLIRNDLSKVADEVSVTRYRYIERIRSVSGELLQVSSEISGTLMKEFENRLGDIIISLLPAGSISGAPKKETLRIISECEDYKRGWFTGVFGVFDGESVDSGVMIRFIENDKGKMYFKSGGGITSLSIPEKEYDELIAKVYVPVG